MILNIAIEQAIRDQVPQMTVSVGTAQDDIYQAVRAIMRANPDIFWFSNQWKYSEEDHTVHFRYTFSKERSLMAKEQIQDVLQNDCKIDELPRLSVLEQVMYVYKWLALYCQPNKYSAYNQTIYSVFVCRNSVCTGYAKAAQYLFKQLGIESKLAYGTIFNAGEESEHCWLIVKIDGQWYHFDPIFANPDMGKLLQMSEIEPIFGTKGLLYNYFCCDTKSIKRSRIIEDENDLPACTSTIDYKSVQDVPIHLHRNENAEIQGVKGCLLSNAGNFSDVYLWHSDDNVQKVVKIFKKDTSHDLLRYECRVMRDLSSSPSVIHFCGVTDHQDGIIMEQATPLADLLCCHYFQLSAVDLCNLLLDVLAGLQDCIKHGIYYRDIHLNNIYRLANGRYVLGDFGSCAYMEEGQTKCSQNIGGVSSPWYSAPETFTDGIFDESSATYEVGMLAYFLLNELLPPLWKEYGKSSIDKRMQGHELPKPALLKDSSNTFEQILAHAISKSLSFESPELFRCTKRYLKLSDLERDIRHCLSTAKNNDHLLIDGGSCEWFLLFDRTPGLDKTSYNAHTSFHLTCWAPPSPPTPDREIIFPNLTTSHAESSMHKTENRNVFERTADEDTSNPTTYQPGHIRHSARKDSNKTSLWSKIFGKKGSTTEEDEVYSSVFAPAELKRKSHMLVQVFLHLYEETEKVNALAKEAQKDAQRRDYIPLQCKLRRSDKVDVLMNIYGESLLMSEKKSVVWQGAFTKCTFDYFVPFDIEADELSCMAILTVNGVQIGEMRFVTSIVAKPRELHPEVFTRQYKKIFISYAHQDESKVKYIARAYDAQGVDYFFDRHYLKPGDIFPLKIKEYIDSADLFVLCWSANAAKSEYVDLERRQALERAFPQVKPFEEAPLSIYPMSIEPRAELPEDMKHSYNFDVI